MRNHTRPLVLALAGALAACSDINYQAPVAFEGRLAPRTEAGVSGQVAAVSQHQNTQAGIDVRANDAARFGWQINHGTCAVPGPIVGGRGNYPDVATNDTGVGQIERTFISELLTEDREYHAVLVDAATRQTILACGNLAVKSF